MTLLAPSVGTSGPAPDDDVPINLIRKPVRADRAFNGLLAGSSALVLLLLVGIVLFLFVHGWQAIHTAGLGLFFDKSWNPDAHSFDIWPLLIGTMAIALIAVVLAAPISIALALMINEYAPRGLRPWMTGTVDLLATVPSIVYGFWGLQLISGVQAAPARWLVDHVSFVPIFRTSTPGQFVQSIFACGLICTVTLIPIVTSISREVMAQAPRDVCEAALGLGGTRWGMVTDVILPFSRNGILGAILLAVGRGLGETMIVVLVLSSANHLSVALLGPGGLGSIPFEITTRFDAGSPMEKSALIMCGLILFTTTLVLNLVARAVVSRSNESVL